MLILALAFSFAFVGIALGPGGLVVTNDVQMRNHTLRGLAAPVSGDEAANRDFVLAHAGGGACVPFTILSCASSASAGASTAFHGASFQNVDSEFFFVMLNTSFGVAIAGITYIDGTHASYVQPAPVLTVPRPPWIAAQGEYSIAGVSVGGPTATLALPPVSATLTRSGGNNISVTLDSPWVFDISAGDLCTWDNTTSVTTTMLVPSADPAVGICVAPDDWTLGTGSTLSVPGVGVLPIPLTFSSCKEVLDSGFTAPGVYELASISGAPSVYCLSGWTLVVQYNSNAGGSVSSSAGAMGDMTSLVTTGAMRKLSDSVINEMPWTDYRVEVVGDVSRVVSCASRFTVDWTQQYTQNTGTTVNGHRLEWCYAVLTQGTQCSTLLDTNTYFVSPHEAGLGGHWIHTLGTPTHGGFSCGFGSAAETSCTINSNYAVRHWVR